MGSLDSEDRDRDREITDRVAADQGGEDRIAKLEARIDELESRQSRSAWSRRGMLGLLGVGGVSVLSGNAAAGSAQVGTIGTQNNPIDLEAEDITADSVDTNQLTTVNETQSGDEGSVSFSGLSNNDNTVTELHLRVKSKTDTNGDLQMRINGATSLVYETRFTNGNTVFENGIVLYSTTQKNAEMMGTLRLSVAGNNSSAVTGPIAGHFNGISRSLLTGSCIFEDRVNSLSFVSTQSGSSNYNIVSAAVSTYQY